MNVTPKMSPNFSHRPSPSVDCIIIHDTVSRTAGPAIEWFQNRDSGVSAHYVVDTDGAVYQCVDEVNEAWHAGISELWGRDNVNGFSIGIELASMGTSPYPDTQLDSLVDLVA